MGGVWLLGDKRYCVVTWPFLPPFRTRRYRRPSRTWPPTRPTFPSTRTTRGCSRSSTNWRPSSAPEQRGPVRDPKPSWAPQASVEMPVCESGGHTPKFCFYLPSAFSGNRGLALPFHAAQVYPQTCGCTDVCTCAPTHRAHT